MVPTTSIVLPVFVRPAPATIWPAPLNCTKVRLVVPNVIVPSVVSTQPLSLFVVPSSTNAKAPLVISVPGVLSKSLARVQAPAATTYIPF